MRALYIFWTQILYQIYVSKYFFSVHNLSLQSLNGFFQRAKVLTLIKSSVFLFSLLWTVLLVFHLRTPKSSSNLSSQGFSHVSFIVLGFTFRSVVYFELNFYYSVTYKSAFRFFVHVCPASVVAAATYWKPRISTSHDCIVFAACSSKINWSCMSCFMFGFWSRVWPTFPVKKWIRKILGRQATIFPVTNRPCHYSIAAAMDNM